MTMTSQVLYVPDDARFPVELREADPESEDVLWMVGGQARTDVTPQHELVFSYEDAEAEEMKHNGRATILARRLGLEGRLFQGPVVFAGPVDVNGHFTDCTGMTVAGTFELGIEILTGSGAVIQRVT